MILKWINKVFSLFHGIVSVITKLLCFMHLKRRKNSGSILPMHNDETQSYTNNTVMQQSLPSNDHTDMELESWDKWGTEDLNVSLDKKDIEQTYSNYLNCQGVSAGKKGSTNVDNESEIDYFQDMIPKVKKQPKIIIRKTEEVSQKYDGFSKRLALNNEVPLNADPLLGTWDDSQNDWEDELSEDLSWDALSAIKERKRIEREQRQADQLNKKQERERQRLQKANQLSAIKLS